MYALCGYDVIVTSQRRFLNIFTIFVRFSVFLLRLWVHDAFDFQLRVIKWIGIQLAFIQCAPHVVMKSLVTSQSQFPKSMTCFSYCCFLTAFVIACWILLPVITHQMNGHQISFRFTYALFGYDVTCDVTKSFSKSITRFSQDLLPLTLVWVHYAFNFRLRYIKWIGIQ